METTNSVLRHIVETADVILNGLIILMVVYFSLLYIGIAIREFSESRKRRKAERIRQADAHR